MQLYVTLAVPQQVNYIIVALIGFYFLCHSWAIRRSQEYFGETLEWHSRHIWFFLSAFEWSWMLFVWFQRVFWAVIEHSGSCICILGGLPMSLTLPWHISKTLPSFFLLFAFWTRHTTLQWEIPQVMHIISSPPREYTCLKMSLREHGSDDSP